MTLTEYFTRFDKKRVVIVGIGVSNLPILRLLIKSGAKLQVRDKKPRERLAALLEEFEPQGVEFVLGEHYLETIEGDYVFRTPGLHKHNPGLKYAAEQGAVILTEMQILFEVCPCPIFAVTGSEGKTTTSTIVAKMLEADGKKVWLGGNIGRPILAEMESIAPTDFVVLELSSFQLLDLHRSPTRAIITNMTPNHLDVHPDLADYYGAKGNIVNHQSENDIAVLSANDQQCQALMGKIKSKLRLFSPNPHEDVGAFVSENALCLRSEDGTVRKVIDIDKIKLIGSHNVLNCLAACAMLDGVCSPDAMVKVMTEFGGVEHRIEFVRQLNGVKYYNDSSATTPSRTEAALDHFSDLILIAGGSDKGISYAELGVKISKKVKKLLLCGTTADKIEEATLSSPQFNEQKTEIVRCRDIEYATHLAHEMASEGDVVLLSPASASFDNFINCEYRGRFFKEVVNKL